MEKNPKEDKNSGQETSGEEAERPSAAYPHSSVIVAPPKLQLNTSAAAASSSENNGGSGSDSASSSASPPINFCSSSSGSNAFGSSSRSSNKFRFVNPLASTSSFSTSTSPSSATSVIASTHNSSSAASSTSPTNSSAPKPGVLQPSKLFLRPSVLKFGGNTGDTDNQSSKAAEKPAESVTKPSFAFVSLDKKPFEPKTELGPPPHKKPTLRRTDSQTTDEDPEEVEVVVGDQVSNGCSEANKAEAPSSSTGDPATFVFGEQLDARAVVKPKVDDENSADSIKDAVSPGGQENLKDTGGDDRSSPSPLAVPSASTECRSPSGDKKRKYEAVTGEEDELNVMQVHAKLYSFDTDTSSWKEKGRGPLRLNDRVEGSVVVGSRLIMRTGGTLCVILNTPIVAGMIFKRESNLLRFGSTDGIYGIRGKANEIERLQHAIECRLSESQKRLRSENTTEEGAKDETHLEPYPDDASN